MKKRKRINRNSIPFLLLAIIHLGMLAFLVVQKRDKTTWLLLLSNVGLAYFFEYIVLNLFNAYTYKPSIIKKRYLDNIFGAILSQGIFVPITTTFLTIFQKGWRWRLGFIFYFMFIEKLFIRLNIYKVNWWKSIYTVILMPIYFFISNKFYKTLLLKKDWSLKIAHFLSIEVIGINLLYISALKREIRFGRGHHHTWREHFIIGPLYSVFLNIILVMNTTKSGLLHRMYTLITFIGIDQILVKFGILKMNFKQSLRTIPIHVFMILVSRTLYHWIYDTKS
ncbi:hypothetical protein GH741_20640 [Aquibacillus halophilus]|uniref:Uncharacterized protein n=1 Tax=Aquibacillus halophilus TaxID=930132 RepID=A0A6A8DHA4_9BACI|nr:hypothetical protein [Aquibacillus halophilus]MRH45053.1 hypothetical protein [Aquibacillus halophilus]